MSVDVLPWRKRTGAFVAKELRKLLPPTIYFFCAFNLIAFTTTLMVQHYWFALSSFLVATTMALIVGKVLLIFHRVPFIERLRTAPLIATILYKTAFYTLVVGVVRVLEVFIEIARDDRGVHVAFQSKLGAFTWEHFTAVQVWLFVSFLLYVLIREIDTALGQHRLFKLLFHRRS